MKKQEILFNISYWSQDNNSNYKNIFRKMKQEPNRLF